MHSNDYESYHEYLKKTSLVGDFYRNFYLYPRIYSRLRNRILDVGCGLGLFARKYQGVYACDINPVNVEMLKSYDVDAKVINENRLDYPSNFFQSILLDNVIEHIDDPSELLNEIKRVLTKQGILAIGVPGIAGFKLEVDHKKFYNLNDLINILSPRGFNLFDHFYTPFESVFLDKKMKQYCLYAFFRLSDQ